QSAISRPRSPTRSRDSFSRALLDLEHPDGVRYRSGGRHVADRSGLGSHEGDHLILARLDGRRLVALGDLADPVLLHGHGRVTQHALDELEAYRRRQSQVHGLARGAVAPADRLAQEDVLWGSPPGPLSFSPRA